MVVTALIVLGLAEDRVNAKVGPVLMCGDNTAAIS